ncbi:MAG: DUF2267 domain-containing protein [Spirochaetota bacterium]
MPVPAEYQRIYDHLYDFLQEVRDICDIETTHRSYTTIQGVFQTFRRRVDFAEAVGFSNLLPAGIRALFVAEWDLQESKLDFTSRTDLIHEIQYLRRGHNFAPDTAIQDVAQALHRHVESDKLAKYLGNAAQQIQNYWNPKYRGDFLADA